MLVVLAVVNLAAGFGLAWLWDRFVSVPPDTHYEEPVPAELPAPAEEQSVSTDAANPVSAMLDEIGVQCADFSQAGLCAQLFAQQRLKEALTALDSCLRADDDVQGADDRLAAEAIQWGHRWLDIARIFSQPSGGSAENEAAAWHRQLATACLDYAAELQVQLAVLAGDERHDDARLVGDRRVAPTQRLLDICYSARTTLQNLLAETFDLEEMDAIPAPFWRDPATNRPSRLELQLHVANIAARTPAPPPPCWVLIDVDRHHRINQQFGPAVGDALIDALGTIFAKTLDTLGESSGLCHLGGQAFLAALTTTSLDNAQLIAEMLRQTVEATTFEVAGQPVELTISCGVAQLASGESSGQLLDRLSSVLSSARTAGRNRVSVDCGEPYVVQPEPLQVHKHMVQVTATTAPESPVAVLTEHAIAH